MPVTKRLFIEYPDTPLINVSGESRIQRIQRLLILGARQAWGRVHPTMACLHYYGACPKRIQVALERLVEDGTIECWYFGH